jgi:hypothetical protein
MRATAIWSDDALLSEQKLVEINAINAKALAEACGLEFAVVDSVSDGMRADTKILGGLIDGEPFQVGIKRRLFSYRGGSLLGTRHRIGPLFWNPYDDARVLKRMRATGWK